MKRGILVTIVGILCWGLLATAREKPRDAEKLGNVHFPVSCLPATQPQFDRAVAMLHSFWYPQGLNAFAEIAKTDPSCAMVYWGIAISRRANPMVGAPGAGPDALKDAVEAASKARLAGAKTQRERDYIAAIETYYNDWEKRDYRTRVLAYEKAMEDVYLHYPEDPEAAVFYALAIDEAVNVLPLDPNFTRQQKAGAILEKVLAANPEHPGALHYLIHAYDFPQLADRGLAAARQYGDVAPAAPHALHMPSHIYSMLGMWQESIKANQAALFRVERLCSCAGFHGLFLSPDGARYRGETRSRPKHRATKEPGRCGCRCCQPDWGRIGRLHCARGDSRTLCDRKGSVDGGCRARTSTLYSGGRFHHLFRSRDGLGQSRQS